MMNTIEQPLVSIIIPVYNAKAHLEACVQSILDQSYKNFELLLIDDGSSDGSSELCDELSQKSEKIRVIHKENGGVSSARNAGLDIASGDYIVFVDSDDVISNNYLESFLESAHKGDLILGMIEDLYFDDAGSIVKRHTRNVDAPDCGILADEYYKLLELLRVPVVKLYKRDIIEANHIRFDENLSVAEDQVFNFAYYKHIKTYALELRSVYKYYHQYNSSSLSSTKTKKTFESELYKLQVEYDFIKDYSPKNADLVYVHHMISMMNIYCDLKDDSGILSFYKRVKRIANLNPIKADKALNKKKKLIVDLLNLKLYGIVTLYYYLKK